MDVSDAYLKLREQILLYNNPDNDLERTGGLNLINTTNLSYFDSSQKSELFRLKAIFLASLRRTSKSNQAYCHSVQICPSHTKSWVSWGGLCSSLGTMTEKQAEQARTSGADNMRESRADSTKKVAQYLAQAMGCFIEAIQIDPNEKSRIHLPRCLWMLTKDGSSPGVLCQTLENRGTKLPPWVWLPWIPQLLTGLCRLEGRAIKVILSRVIKAYPQAAYYSLRAFYLERRDVERAKGGNVAPGQHMASVAYAEEMMSTLRRSHASLWSSLEAILEELIVKFRPSYEEELLATISALLERAESHAEKQSLPDKKRVEDEEAMVASWSKTLSRIAAKFFRETDSSSSTNRRDERVKKTADFKRKYKADFEEDFKVATPEAKLGASATASKAQFRLAEYITKLQAWKEKLEIQVARTPNFLPLIESSHSLAMFHGNFPNLWPGSCDTRYSSANSRSLAEDTMSSRTPPSASSSAAIARKAALSAAVTAAKAAAREGVGGEYGGGSASIEIPGQYCPNTSSSVDIKPCPELHAKLIKFEPYVEVLRRNDQLVRRCGMIGSDGRTYKFLLQFAIPYWTRTDERAAQTSYVIDKFLRKNMVSARNHIHIQPTAAIPVAQRLRMTPDPECRLALDEVWRSHREEVKDGKSVANFFSKELTNRLKEAVSHDASDENKRKAEKEVRFEVYQEICGSMVDDRIFLRYLLKVFDGPESFFLFRRAFAVQLAANSLLQYVFSVTERTPQRFVILQSNGKMMSPDFRISYSNQGFIEGYNQVPFRMTPNIQRALGEHYIQGIFVRSMAMVAGAVKEHKEEFDPILRLLMRDDILAWYSKSLSKTDSKTQELEKQLIERVSKNVYTLQSRFSECSPKDSSNESYAGSKNGTATTLDKRVNELLEAATRPEKLSMTRISYQGWL
jgi:transformation/transcription domain-associated protein